MEQELALLESLPSNPAILQPGEAVLPSDQDQEEDDLKKTLAAARGQNPPG